MALHNGKKVDKNESDQEDSFTLAPPNTTDKRYASTPGHLNGSMPPIRRKNPPTIKVVIEAIKFLDDRHGSTYAAIKNWTLANYPEINRNRLKFMLTKALEKGVKDGTIRNMNDTSPEFPMTVGRFKLVSRKKKAQKNINKKVDVEDKENTTKEGTKSKKQATKEKAKSVKPPNQETVSDTEAPSTKKRAPRRRSHSETDFVSVVEKPLKATATRKKKAPVQSEKTEVSITKTNRDKAPAPSEEAKVPITKTTRATSKKSTVSKKTLRT